MIEGGVYQSQLQSKKSVLHEVSSFLIFQRSSEEIQKIKKSRSSTAVLRSNTIVSIMIKYQPLEAVGE